MKIIGGYFELELPRKMYTYHSATAFKSGRSALHFILNTIKPENVYIPFFTCNALLEPFVAAKVPYQFYSLNDTFEPASLPLLKKGEYLLYINYFGLQEHVIEKLAEQYAEQLIVDCSQAFFYKGDGRFWVFNSCRKFFGVPDGAYVYGPKEVNINAPEEKNNEYTLEHLLQRFNGATAEGYKAFQQNEFLCNADIKGMSKISEHLLSHIDFEDCIQKRKENYVFLQRAFGDNNIIKMHLDSREVPMVYPLLLEKKIKHEQLWEQNLFVPFFWKDVENRSVTGFDIEKQWAAKLLPLPIDQRYTIDDMHLMSQIIKAL